MGQNWFAFTAAVFAPGALNAHLPTVEVKLSPRGQGSDPTAAVFRCDYEHPVRAPWGVVHPGMRSGLAQDARWHVRALPLRPSSHPETGQSRMDEDDAQQNQRMSGTQAVMRAVDILIAVSEGPISLPDLVDKVKIPRPTCHRIATALAERGLILTSGRSGYRLGPMIKELARRSGN